MVSMQRKEETVPRPRDEKQLCISEEQKGGLEGMGCHERGDVCTKVQA